MIFPNEREPCPLTSEVIAVTSSGSDVPKAIIVKAITDSGTPIAPAMITPLSTNRLAPNAIPIAPTTNNNMFCQTGFSFFPFLPLLLRFDSLLQVQLFLLLEPFAFWL